MTVIGRFLVYNLLASLATGAATWVLVVIVLRLLKARSAYLHAGFLVLPLAKSILVLLGVDQAFPWPVGWLQEGYRRAIPLEEVLPFALAWFALAVGSYALLAWKARRKILEEAREPGRESGGQVQRRLDCALERVTTAYRQSPCCEAGETICCIADRVPDHPRLLVSGRLRSPAALVDGGKPVVIFPEALIPCLDDDELALALAHELNHFALRKPAWRNSGSVRLLALASPIAFLLADYLHREEEKACDDLAVAILGQPETYAGMLVKTCQFARAQARPAWPKPLSAVPHLVGVRPFLTERVERLLKPAPAGKRAAQSAWITSSVWVALLYSLFLAR